MKKRILSAIFAALMALSLTACGGTPQADSGAAPEQTPAAPKVPMQTQEQDSYVSLEIKESGYSMTSGGYLYYAVELHNPNEEYAIQYPTIRVTARDADGVLLGTTDQVLSLIYPQQDFWYCGQAFDVEQEPETVEIEFIEPDDYNIVRPAKLEQPDFIPLVAENTAVRGDKVVGEIKNENDYDISSIIVCAILRDENGNMVGGQSTFVNKLPASESVPFDMSLYSDFQGYTCEIYANIW